MNKAQLKKFERAAYKAGHLDKDGYFCQSNSDFRRDIRGLIDKDRKELAEYLKGFRINRISSSRF